MRMQKDIDTMYQSNKAILDKAAEGNKVRSRAARALKAATAAKTATAAAITAPTHGHPHTRDPTGGRPPLPPPLPPAVSSVPVVPSFSGLFGVVAAPSSIGADMNGIPPASVASNGNGNSNGISNGISNGNSNNGTGTGTGLGLGIAAALAPSAGSHMPSGSAPSSHCRLFFPSRGSLIACILRSSCSLFILISLFWICVGDELYAIVQLLCFAIEVDFELMLSLLYVNRLAAGSFLKHEVEIGFRRIFNFDGHTRWSCHGGCRGDGGHRGRGGQRRQPAGRLRVRLGLKYSSNSSDSRSSWWWQRNYSWWRWVRFRCQWGNSGASGHQGCCGGRRCIRSGPCSRGR